MSDYPKWVQRAPDIGPVLCLTAEEEKRVLAEWEVEQAAKTQALLTPEPRRVKDK
jgi:hypothetical protein